MQYGDYNQLKYKGMFCVRGLDTLLSLLLQLNKVHNLKMEVSF